MNVISGKYRGKKLKALEGRNTRPTTQRVKEDMFNILNNYFIFDDKISLDLFGGSGALSIEGISRGIKTAYINDHYKPALKVIEDNLKGINPDSYELFNLDYLQFLNLISFRGLKIDLIYLDPPFAQVQYYYDFFSFIKAKKLLNQYGIVITEAENQLDLDQISSLVLLKYKEYKNKHLYIFRNEKEE